VICFSYINISPGHRWPLSIINSQLLIDLQLSRGATSSGRIYYHLKADNRTILSPLLVKEKSETNYFHRQRAGKCINRVKLIKMDEQLMNSKTFQLNWAGEGDRPHTHVSTVSSMEHWEFSTQIEASSRSNLYQKFPISGERSHAHRHSIWNNDFYIGPASYSDTRNSTSYKLLNSPKPNGKSSGDIKEIQKSHQLLFWGDDELSRRI